MSSKHIVDLKNTVAEIVEAIDKAQEALLKSFYTDDKAELLLRLEILRTGFIDSYVLLDEPVVITSTRSRHDTVKIEDGDVIIESHIHNWNFNRSTGHLECLNKPCESVRYD